MSDPTSPWLTRKEAAAYAKVSPQTIDVWRRTGLPSTKIGKPVRIRLADLEAFLNPPQQSAPQAA